VKVIIYKVVLVALSIMGGTSEESRGLPWSASFFVPFSFFVVLLSKVVLDTSYATANRELITIFSAHAVRTIEVLASHV